jgi:SAM-dependent methyltransferase
MKDEVTVNPKTCPICSRPTIYAYGVTEESEPNKGTGMFFKCSCGIIFQDKFPDVLIPYNKKYIEDYVGAKEFEDRSIHTHRTYINLIEELTYGRRWLDVGYCYERPMNWLRERGWICWGIEVNKEIVEDTYHLKGNFEDYDFRDKEFDVVWMGHVLEHFKDPIGALKRTYALMPEDGVVVITTPDVDFIHQTSPVRFPHWKHNEHYTLWNKVSLRREAEKLGFQVIMCRSNFSERFMAWFDVHAILQKIYV